MESFADASRSLGRAFFHTHRLTSNSKREYRALCDKEPSIPVFSRPWWLDAVSGPDNWDVAIVKLGTEIVATMPYFRVRRLGFTLITQPPLTQTLGPWLKPVETDARGRIEYQHAIFQALLEQLPPFDYFHQRWHHAYTDWLPFYWAGFEQTTRYTYILDDLTDLDEVLSKFSNDIRRRIRKAERGKIRIKFDVPIEAFYENRKMTLTESGEEISYSYDLFKRIYEAGYANGAARAIGAYDEEGNLHAAAFNIWDENSTYDLIGTADRRFRSSGGTSLLMWRQIQHASTKSRCFDFEGSMIKSVETFARSFNPRQVPYHCLSKTPSRLYSLARFTRDLVTRHEGAT